MSTMANIEITRTATGWHIKAVAPWTSGTFTADLPECKGPRHAVHAYRPCSRHFHSPVDCAPSRSRCRLSEQSGGYHPEHVRKFMERVAGTYAGKTDIPEVPA